MDIANWFQILEEAVCILPKNGMNPTISPLLWINNKTEKAL